MLNQLHHIIFYIILKEIDCLLAPPALEQTPRLYHRKDNMQRTRHSLRSHEPTSTPNHHDDDITNLHPNPLSFDAIYSETALLGTFMRMRRYDSYGRTDPPSVTRFGSHTDGNDRHHAVLFLTRNLTYVMTTRRRAMHRRKRQKEEYDEWENRHTKKKNATLYPGRSERPRTLLSNTFTGTSAIHNVLRASKKNKNGTGSSLDLLWTIFQHRPQFRVEPTSSEVTTGSTPSEESVPVSSILIPTISSQQPMDSSEVLSIDYGGDHDDNTDEEEGTFKGKSHEKRQEYKDPKPHRSRPRIAKQVHAATKPDRKFPLYKPFDGYQWIRPTPARSAYQLFCEWRRTPFLTLDDDSGGDQLEDVSLSHEVEDILEERELKTLWQNICVGDYLYFMQEALWDKERFLNHLCTYNNHKKGISMTSSEIRAFVRSELDHQNFTSDGRPKRTSPVVFHYLYHGGGDTIEILKETRRDRMCPFCLFDGASSIIDIFRSCLRSSF